MTFEHTMTNLPIESEYPKLVRDNIPAIIQEADGRVVPVRKLSDSEFLVYLLKKVVEESQELADTTTDSHLLEEMADVQEILDTIAKFKSFTPDQLQAVQDEKRQKRGGFTLRLLMLNNDSVAR